MIIKLLGIAALAILLVTCSESKPESDSENYVYSDPLPESDTLREDENAIVIRLGITDEVMIDGKNIVVDSLPQELLKAQKIKGDSAVISVHMRLKTQYQLYADLQMILERNLYDKREAASLKQFNKHYLHLDDKQKAIIDSKHRLRILENRPH